MNLIGVPSKWSRSLRWLLVVSAFAGYVLAFRPLFRLMGPAVGALSMLPVLLAGAVFGQYIGGLSALVLIPLHLHLYPAAGGTDRGTFAACLATAVLGAMTGRLRDLALQLHRGRADIEQALRREQEANARLREREAQLAQAQDVAQVGSWEWDLKTQAVIWSERLYYLFGVEPKGFEPSFEKVMEFVDVADRASVVAGVEGLLRSGGSRLIDFRVRRPDDELREFHARVTAIVGEQGQVTKLVGTLQDVTDQRLLQQRLVLADRLSSVGTLAGGVAHEINNPLAYVISNLEYALQELPALAHGDEQKELGLALDEALDGAERVRRIVKDLKTFARGDEEERSAVDLRKVLDFAAKMTMNELRQHARLVKDYQEIPLVDANECRLGQVFVNLLVNAAQAIPEGHSEQNEIRIVARTDALGRAVIEVRDSGNGIPPEVRSRIFDPFFTTKPVGLGTGLGLSICHGIVSGFGGEIAFESELGKGSTFRVTLPAAETSPAVNEQRPELESSARSRLLIVDDDKLVAAAVRRLLASEHEVELVSDGEAALAKLAARRFDLVLCDLIMPGMSGMELHEQVALRDPIQAARMVFMTGGAFTARAKEFVAARGESVLDKPIDCVRLRKLIAERIATPVRPALAPAA